MKRIGRVFLGLALCIGIPAALHAQENSSVVCSVSSSGLEQSTRHSPQENPLQMGSVDLSNGFRFSGILLQTPAKFKSYVYYESKDRFVLISKQEQLLDNTRCGKKLGRVESYAPYLENHLAYECTYQCER